MSPTKRKEKGKTPPLPVGQEIEEGRHPGSTKDETSDQVGFANTTAIQDPRKEKALLGVPKKYTLSAILMVVLFDCAQLFQTIFFLLRAFR
ncbi:hypothetical protein V6N12_042951 [Hibiscus sabdariffa]|uniref:Uncharacterized protein n=1 Tax=Hibiscus sabdariffa TaxID=183260 RepID=A0ABR2DI99_9ROSI